MQRPNAVRLENIGLSRRLLPRPTYAANISPAALSSSAFPLLSANAHRQHCLRVSLNMVGRRRDSKQRAKPDNDPCPWAGGPCNLTPENLCPSGKKSEQEQCTCSDISYILFAACQACTVSPSITSWDDYARLPSRNCTGLPQQFVYLLCCDSELTFYGLGFPAPYPPVSKQGPYYTPFLMCFRLGGPLAVPRWALVLNDQDPLCTTFDIAVASSIVLHSVTSLPVSTSSVSVSATQTSTTAQASTSATTSVAASGTSDNPTPSATSGSTPSPLTPLTAASKATSQVGPIAGGIIGGAIFLALVGIGIWYFAVRRRRNHIAPSAAYKAAVRAGSTTPMPYQPVHHDSPQSSISYQTDDLRTERAGSWLPSAPASIRSESRFLEHT
ncbi:hypothetical protein DFH09DRAFT_1133545 [Mycena vulgaris]|nr:hypothetical protein DFH09DRAFT_1133545 [Mycena vulgaris]